MKNWWTQRGWRTKQMDWEAWAQKVAMECDDPGDAMGVCDHEMQSLVAQHQPDLASLNRRIENHRHHGESLRGRLYERSIPVNDAAMLTHRSRTRTYLILALIALAAGFSSNFVMFWFLGWSVIWSAVAALAITALPLSLGHIFYEHVVSGSKRAKIVIAILILVAAFAGYWAFGRARRVVADKAIGQSENTSYVDDATQDNADIAQKPQSEESRFQGTLGDALFFLSIAAELASGFLVGLFVHLLTDEDFAAWRELKKIEEVIVELEREADEVLALIEMAKTQCKVGIRRAQAARKKPKTPYYKALLVLVLCGTFALPAIHSQTTQNEEGILIDRSASIGRKTSGDDLFQKYLRSAKRLLATEPPNTRVWVSTIAGDSFGGVTDIVAGWTPEAHGIFTDDLNRARRQLAMSFEAKSANFTANAQGTDIFGGLWHLKVLFEASGSARSAERTIWVFSDMTNETPEFPMPQLLEIGPERMLERARANGLVVPLPHYKIFVYGAAPAQGLTPHAWMKAKRFWGMYFTAAGAELITYSTECGVRQ